MRNANAVIVRSALR